MSITENSNLLSSDRPLSDPKDDRLGYTQFSQNLAEGISKIVSPEGMVIGLYGSWGSGKTTVLEFVTCFLEEKSESEKPIIMRFNPWWFSGHEDLALHFFVQLEATLASKLKGASKKVAELIGGFGRVVSKIPGAEVVEAVADVVDAPKDIHKQKKEIENLLRKQKRHILIIIDDIDRLTAEEIRQLFRVIKAVADFPNIIYLLAFDKEVVVKALQESQGIPGEEYLEKIIQVPFELPFPDKISLAGLLTDKLNEILKDTPSNLWDNTRWGNAFYDGIRHLIDTPRDVIRLINTLSLTYPLVKGEVDAVDFIVVEALRVFYPKIYDIIRRNKSQFAGSISPYLTYSDNKVDQLRSFHRSWMSELQESDRELIKNLLIRLFPILQNLDMGLYTHGGDMLAFWRKRCFICSPEIFDSYFRLSMPQGHISNLQMHSILTLSVNKESFISKLLELGRQKRADGITEVKAFLVRLLDYIDEIPLENISNIVEALFQVGDELILPDDERPFIPFDGNDTHIYRIIWKLLYQLEEQYRFDILKQAIISSSSIALIVDEIIVLGNQHGKFNENGKIETDETKRMIILEHYVMLEEIALNKIQQHAKHTEFIDRPNLTKILWFWQSLSLSEVKGWVQETIESDKGLVRFLEIFLQKIHSQTITDAVSQMHYRLEPKQLEPYVDPAEIVSRLQKLPVDIELTEIQIIAIARFFRAYELIQQGKNPDFDFE